MSFRGTSKLNLARWSRMRSHCFCISLSMNSRLLNLKSFRDLQHMYQTFTFCNYFKDVALFCDFHHFFVDVSKNVTFNIGFTQNTKADKPVVQTRGLLELTIAHARKISPKEKRFV